MPLLKKSLEKAREYIVSSVNEGDLAVDATAGNGHDTVLLAELVGKRGRVISFDIQEEAIAATRKRLRDNNLLERVELLHEGHENLLRHVKGEVAAVMFNLGYLPGGDHSIITRKETTIEALNAVLTVLRRGGIITVVVYTGHQGGKEEGDALLDYCSGLEQGKYTVLYYQFLNQSNEPPSLLVIEKP